MLLSSYQQPLLSDLGLPVPSTAKGIYATLQGKQGDYDIVEKYLAGSQELRFATEKFNNAFGGLFRSFANNYMKRVVTALSDYLQLDTVEVGDKGTQKQLQDWWELQRLQVQSGRIHHDAFAYGAGYAILSTAKNDQNRLRLYRQNPRQVAVVYDPEQPERIILAVKLWQALDKRWRLNVYEPDVTRRYVTQASSNTTAPSSIGAFEPFRDDGAPDVRNDLGIVPVFHFANDPDNGGQGKSELDDLIPLQDGLNKSLMDMLVAMEFQAYRQRWATGIEVRIDPDTNQPIQPFHGADRLWIAQPQLDGEGKPVPTHFGEFGIVDLKQFLSVSEAFRTEIARLSRIPLHHLMMMGDFPSGEALKTAEQPLIAKVRDRQMQWGNVWEDVARYVLMFQGMKNPPKLEAVWTDVQPQSAKQQAEGDLAEAQAAAEKQAIGVSRKQTLRELSYTDEQIAQFELENAEDAAKAAEAAPVATPKGQPPTPAALPAKVMS